MSTNYLEPVAKLLTLGETSLHASRNYLKKGFTREHIPELIRLVEDEELRDLPWVKGIVPPQVYAQVHAWRTLAQLDAVEAIPSLIGLLHFVDEDQDDYIGEEIPKMLGRLGAPAIAPCCAYLADEQNDTFARISAGYALAEIGQQHPESRDACVQALMSTLDDYRNDDREVNAFTISFLADLKAVEAASLVEQVFKGDFAALDVTGDYEDFQIEVGLLEERLTPSPHNSLADLEELTSVLEELEREQKRQQQKAKKEKAKRKQEKKARKRHKRR